MIVLLFFSLFSSSRIDQNKMFTPLNDGIFSDVFNLYEIANLEGSETNFNLYFYFKPLEYYDPSLPIILYYQ